MWLQCNAIFLLEMKIEIKTKAKVSSVRAFQVKLLSLNLKLTVIDLTVQSESYISLLFDYDERLDRELDL